MDSSRRWLELLTHCCHAHRAASSLGVAVLRPFGMVSAPIAARGDDAAIFELLSSVGCRPA
jgi:hypothetical protein